MTCYQETIKAMTDIELGREVATLTGLYRKGLPDHGKLDDVFMECKRRGNMEIFHAAQEREFSRPCAPLFGR
jgi:hypothetical protein